MTKQKTVLAYSGGLDTTYCALYLTKELDMEVHTVIVDTGGFSREELTEIAERARKLGVASHTILQKTDEYYQHCIRYLIFGNILKNHAYPLSVSAERVFQAKAIAEFARQLGATALAHGSTGAGNDQVRFDLAFRVFCPEMEIITPIRDKKLSRQEEIDYLKAHQVTFDFEKALYSVNQGLWGTTVGGKETLTSHQALPEEAYPIPVSKEGPDALDIHFDKGEICSIKYQGEHIKGLKAVELIQALERIGAAYGVGRDVHVGDTVIGIKGRVGFQASAATLLIKAHQHLEKHVLSKWQIYWKEQLAQWYGNLMHEGQFFEPVMRDIEQFLTHPQQVVNGVVHLELRREYFKVLGISSAQDLMQSDFGSYGELNTLWGGEDVKGFAKILANQSLIFNQVNPDYGKN